MMSKQNVTRSINAGPLFENKFDAWDSVDQSIGEACENKGGFVLTGLPPLLMPRDNTLEKFFEFFDLPDSVLYDIAKREMRPDSKLTMRGYVNRDRGGFAYGEQFDVGQEQPMSGPEIDGIDMLINDNAWPSQEPSAGWREELTKHFLNMETLGITVLRSIVRYLGFDESAAAKRYENSSSTLRLLRYPKRPDDIEIRGEKGAMRVVEGREMPLVASEHTDNGGLTMQWQSEPGLQIQTPDGEWLGIPDSRDGFSVHVGETLQTQSSGRLQATPHRVYSTGNTRYSMVFFLEPNLFGSVKPFSTDPNDAYKTKEDSYAASMLETLRRTGRA